MRLLRARWKLFVSVVDVLREKPLSFSPNEWTEKHWEGVRTSGFPGSVPKQMCILAQVTEVLSFLPATWKSLLLPGLSVFLALFSTQKEEFYSLLNGEIRCQMSEYWRKFLLLSLFFQKRGYFHQHFYSSLYPLIWLLPFCPVNSQEGQILDLVHGDILPQKWETGSVHSYFIPPASKGAKLYFVFLLLGRKHARSGCGSVSKGRPRDSVPSSVLYPASYQLEPFR